MGKSVLKKVKEARRAVDAGILAQIEAAKHIRNREIALDWTCEGCDSRIANRARSFEDAKNIALALGWMVVSWEKQVAACPLHNPSQKMFIGYHTPKGLHHAINA